MPMTPPLLPQSVPVPNQAPSSSHPSQSATTGTHPLAPLPARPAVRSRRRASPVLTAVDTPAAAAAAASYPANGVLALRPLQLPPDDCCMCYDTRPWHLRWDLVYLGSCFSPIVAPAVLHRTPRKNRGQPALSGVPGGRSSRRSFPWVGVLRKHSDAVTVEALTVAREAMPAEEKEGGGTHLGHTKGGRWGEIMCRIFPGVAEGAVFVRVSCSCKVHRRCSLGVC